MCHFPAAVKREASVETGDTIAFLYGKLKTQVALGRVSTGVVELRKAMRLGFE